MGSGKAQTTIAMLLATTLVAACVSDVPATQSSAERSASMFTVTSSAFEDGGRIPDTHASPRSGGANRSIPLQWSGAPEKTRSFAVTIIDHSPVADLWVHWAVLDIPNNVSSLAEGVSGTDAMPPGAVELTNTAGGHGYGGPNPPHGSGAHPYVVTVYALSVDDVDPPADVTADSLDLVFEGKTLAKATITGVYGR